jgi:hypothetical protein
MLELTHLGVISRHGERSFTQMRRYNIEVDSEAVEGRQQNSRQKKY